ncbi:MAG: outer membrane lipoprotein chaperone LolA, partial [Pseudomonadales bacterium]
MTRFRLTQIARVIGARALLACCFAGGASGVLQAAQLNSDTDVEPVQDAADARSLLADRLNSLDAYRAHFSQFIEGARGDVIEESTGEIAMQRPRLRWEVDAPYPQIIVANAEEMRIYDPDLAQVMIKPMSKALSETPVALLTQEQVTLNDQFDVVFLPGDDVSAEDVFLLTPLQADSLFQEIRLHFEREALTQLLIFDHLGQYTT